MEYETEDEAPDPAIRHAKKLLFRITMGVLLVTTC